MLSQDRPLTGSMSFSFFNLVLFQRESAPFRAKGHSTSKTSISYSSKPSRGFIQKTNVSSFSRLLSRVSLRDRSVLLQSDPSKVHTLASVGCYQGSLSQRPEYLTPICPQQGSHSRPTSLASVGSYHVCLSQRPEYLTPVSPQQDSHSRPTSLASVGFYQGCLSQRPECLTPICPH